MPPMHGKLQGGDAFHSCDRGRFSACRDGAFGGISGENKFSLAIGIVVTSKASDVPPRAKSCAAERFVALDCTHILLFI